MASDEQRIARIRKELRRRGKLKEPLGYFARKAAGLVTLREKCEMWRDLVTSLLAKIRAEPPGEYTINDVTPLDEAASDLLAQNGQHDANVGALVSRAGVLPSEASGALDRAEAIQNQVAEVVLTRALGEVNTRLSQMEQ